MIKIHMNKGKILEAQVTGTGTEIIAETATIVHSICHHMSLVEDTDKDKAIAYAYFMLKIADSIIDLTKENKKVSELLKSLE